MRVLFIIPDYGSFNNFLAELAVKLLAEGNTLHVICSRDKIINFEDKYDYESLGVFFHYVSYPRELNILAHIRCSQQIHKAIDVIRPDIINIHFARGVLTSLLLKKPNYYTIGTFHGLSFPVVKKLGMGLLFYIIEHFSFRRLDEIWVLNESDYKIISNKYPEKVRLLKSFGLGCDIKRFNPASFSVQERSDLRAQLKINPDDFVLTYTGRFVQFKGFNKVLAAFKRLGDEHHINLKLIMIGGYDSLHSTGLSKAEENELKKSENIILTGFTNQIEKYLSITDLFVFPSTKEGMPVCIMEALAMGVPVLTTNTRGCNELVTDQFNGLLTNADPNVNEIIEKILLLVSNRGLLNKFAQNALNERTKLDRNHFINEQIQIMQSLTH
jgi:glycosyltransferase involved in cell wall biosynthesis